jgi:hypothetical protein
MRAGIQSMEEPMDDAIKHLQREFIESITSYMKLGGAEDEEDPDYDPEFDAGYSQEHIDRCDEILTTFLSELEQVSESDANAEIMEAVKQAVLELNAVNEECEGSLIETDQREQLCEIIISAAREAGLVSDERDITEEWRDW